MLALKIDPPDGGKQVAAHYMAVVVSFAHMSSVMALKIAEVTDSARYCCQESMMVSAETPEDVDADIIQVLAVMQGKISTSEC